MLPFWQRKNNILKLPLLIKVKKKPQYIIGVHVKLFSGTLKHQTFKAKYM